MMLQWPFKTHQFCSCLVIAGKTSSNTNSKGAYLKPMALGGSFKCLKCHLKVVLCSLA